jgi:pseudouridine-5'-phosphate glycosidase
MPTDPAASWLTFSAPVAAARAAGRPLVALESTIIAHGMPYPENVRTAREVESVVRAHGAEPATIAVMEGAFASASTATSWSCWAAPAPRTR